MKNPGFSLVAVGMFILGVAVVCEAVYLSRLQREVSILKRELKDAKAEPAPAPEAAGTPEGNEPPANVPDPPLPVRTVDPMEHASTSISLTPEMQKKLESLVEKKVEERISDKQKYWENGEYKPPLSVLVEELQIDPVTESKVADFINAGKDEVFAVFRSPRMDGGNFVDDLVNALKSGRKQEVQKVFLKMFSEKIPGTEETYIQGYVKVRNAVNSEIRLLLRDEQWKSYESQNVNPLDVKTGYDPFAKYFVEQGVPEEDQ